MKRGLFFFFLFFILANRPASAINCPRGISGGITDSTTGQGLKDVTIAVYVDGAPLAQTSTTRDDGSFSYPYPISGNALLAISRPGYQPTTFSPSSCQGITVSLVSSGPTPTPGTNPRCNATCATPDQCLGATDGCNVCYSGRCTTAQAIPTPSLTPQPRQPCPGSICQTALGPINVSSPSSFIAFLLKFAIGIGGGIAFLLMLFGAFQIITSAGDPERLKAGKELITSALMGLLLIIFSLFLLRLIGVEILQIPGF